MSKASIGIFVALAVASAACGKMKERAEEAAIEHATGGKVHVSHDGTGMSVSSSDGDASVAWGIGGAAKIPDNFPKKVPIYPNTKVLSSMSSAENGKTGFVVNLESSDPPDQVVTFYKTNLSSMTSKMDMQSAAGHMMNFEDPGDKTAVVLVINGDDKTHKTLITLTVGH